MLEKKLSIKVPGLDFFNHTIGLQFLSGEGLSGTCLSKHDPSRRSETMMLTHGNNSPSWVRLAHFNTFQGHH